MVVMWIFDRENSQNLEFTKQTFGEISSKCLGISRYEISSTTLYI
jgi:hypothetical protein